MRFRVALCEQPVGGSCRKGLRGNGHGGGGVAHGVGSSLLSGSAVAALTDTPWPWPTPAGAARASGGFPPLAEEAIAGTERAERSGGLHKRSAEDEGAACARQGRSPSGRPGYLISAERAVLLFVVFVPGLWELTQGCS